MSAKNPTKKQREMLNFIENFISEHGFSPSYREIMNSLGYQSVSTVAIHVDNLIALGCIQKTDHSARSLEVIGQDESYNNPSVIKPSQEKWLVDIIAAKFKTIEKKKPTQKEVDDLFMLIGALRVLGLEDIAKTFKTKLDELSSLAD